MGHLARIKILFLPALTFFLLAAFFWRIFPPLSSTDTYFHLAVGKQVWQTKQIPKFDEFTFVAQNKAWISNEWLSGLIFYAFYHLAAENGILLLRILTGTAIAALIYYSRPKASRAARLAVTLFVSLALSLRTFDRPEILSYLAFALLIFLLERFLKDRKTKFLLPLPFIFLLWPNIQGYAPLSLVVLGFYLLTDFAAAGKSPIRYFKTNGLLAVTLLTSAFFALVQFQRFFYVLFLNSELFNLVSEVQSLGAKLASIKYDFWQNVPLEFYLYLFLIASALLVIRHFSKSKAVFIIQISYLLFCLTLGANYFRAIPLAILLASPLLVKNLAQEKYLLPVSKGIIAVTSLLILISIFQKKPFLYSTNTLFVFDKQGQIFLASNSTWKQTKPTAALAFIKGRYIPSKVLTSFNWSNQVIWEFGGKSKVAGDIIYEKQNKQSLTDYQTLSIGKENWQKILQKYDPDIVINSLPLNLTELFEVPMWELSNWKLVYVDETAAVYAKEENSNFRALTHLHPELETKIKSGEEKEAKEELQYLLSTSAHNSFAKQQLTVLALGQNPQEALDLAQKSQREFPLDPNFYILSAQAKEKLNACRKSTLDLSRAKRLSRGYYYLLRQINELAISCGISL